MNTVVGLSLALSLITGSVPTPLHQTRAEVVRSIDDMRSSVPGVQDAGTEDAYIVVDGHRAQLEYLDLIREEWSGTVQCEWYEDGSANCE